VVGIAVLTAIIPSLISGNWGHWIYTALNFLMISCPCALVLSVPLAFFSGIGAGSAKGILFKDGLTLEALDQVKAVVMDKTGTLTEGSFTVTAMKSEGSLEELVRYAAALESFSNHPVAKSILLHVGEEVDTEQCVKELGLPVFVKPNAGGSSYATTKVKTPEELQPAIAAAKREATGEVIIESFMQGTEVTCGCYTSRDGLRALPITEVVSKKEFFDVDAKYNGAVEEITPARISDEMTQKIQALTRRIYGYVGAKGIIRVDYIIIGDTPHLLEVNTTPGMTATSFIPQEVRAAGLDISDVMDDVITFGSL
jgi:D-alanine-D-alanine ligase-like ATP-grasp enzyme